MELYVGTMYFHILFRYVIDKISEYNGFDLFERSIMWSSFIMLPGLLCFVRFSNFENIVSYIFFALLFASNIYTYCKNYDRNKVLIIQASINAIFFNLIL